MNSTRVVPTARSLAAPLSRPLLWLSILCARRVSPGRASPNKRKPQSDAPRAAVIGAGETCRVDPEALDASRGGCVPSALDGAFGATVRCVSLELGLLGGEPRDLRRVSLRATRTVARSLCGHGHFVLGCHHCLPRVTQLRVRRVGALGALPARPADGPSTAIRPSVACPRRAEPCKPLDFNVNQVVLAPYADRGSRRWVDAGHPCRVRNQSTRSGYIIPLMSGIPPPPPFVSAISATIASVVRMFLAIEAAFCSAERVTIAGSMMPSLTRSTI